MVSTIRHFVKWLLLFSCCLFFNCVCEKNWKEAPQKSTCNPKSSRYNGHPGASILNEMLKQQPNGVPVCLQMGWGVNDVKQTQSKMAFFRADGSLFTRNGDKIEVPSLILPGSSGGQRFRFRLYVFVPSFQRGAASYCQTEMNSPTYDCFSQKERDVCLVYFAFRPQSDDNIPSFEVGGPPDSTCHLFLRPDSTEASTELTKEVPKESVEETTLLEELAQEEPQVRKELTQKEPKPEVLTEHTVEHIPQEGFEKLPTEELVEKSEVDAGEDLPEQPSDIKEGLPEGRETVETKEFIPEAPVCKGAINGKCKEWLRLLGGFGFDSIVGVSQDKSGNIYVAGTLHSKGLTIGSATNPKTFGMSDIFVGKLDATGKWLWVQSAGSKGGDAVWTMDFDEKNGALYVGGVFNEEATFGSFTLKRPTDGSKDFFIAKIDTKGKWLWVKSGPGRSNSDITSIKVGPQGNVYVGGFFSDTLQLGTTTHSKKGSHVYFLAKMDAKGKWLWSQSFNPNHKKLHPNNYGVYYGPTLAVTGKHGGLLYVGGEFGLNAKVGPYQPKTKLDMEAFVSGLDLNGKWKWLLRVNSPNMSNVHQLAIAPDGSAIATLRGMTNVIMGTTKVNIISRDFTPIGGISPKGNWTWATGIGSRSYCRGLALAVDLQNNIFVTGNFGSTCTFGSLVLSNGLNSGLFVAKMDKNRKWQWALRGGGYYPKPILSDVGRAISVSSTGAIVVVGAIQQPAIGQYSTIHTLQETQAFIAKDIHKTPSPP